MSNLHTVAMLYKKRFGDTPTIVNLSDDAENKAISVLLKAMDDGKPISDQDFYKELGATFPDPTESVI